jgi:hypothetical protein
MRNLSRARISVCVRAISRAAVAGFSGECSRSALDRRHFRHRLPPAITAAPARAISAARMPARKPASVARRQETGAIAAAEAHALTAAKPPHPHSGTRNGSRNRLRYRSQRQADAAAVSPARTPKRGASERSERAERGDETALAHRRFCFCVFAMAIVQIFGSVSRRRGRRGGILFKPSSSYPEGREVAHVATARNRRS